LSFSFNSVDDFLRKAQEAKSEKREEMHEWVQDFVNDPSMVGVPVEMAEDIGRLMEKYGDECLRQIALFTLGKWYGVHVGVVQEMVATEDFGSAIAASMDAARINTSIQTLEGVGSFGGDDDWRQMLSESIVSEVDEHRARQGDDS
jgi:hypothetical protein